MLAGELEGFNAPMAELRKETMTWFRYYTQLDDVAFTLRENELGIFSEREQMLFRMLADRMRNRSCCANTARRCRICSSLK